MKTFQKAIDTLVLATMGKSNILECIHHVIYIRGY